MINEKAYLTLLQQDAAQPYPENAALIRVTDPEEIRAFEMRTGLPCGVLQNQPYYDFRMDVFRNRSGKTFRYCSVSYPKSGAAVLVVLRSGQETYFLLNRQFRPFLNAVVYELPRGFGDPSDADAFSTAVRELAEETGIDVKEQALTVTKLGDVHPDSGLTNSTVALFLAEIALQACPPLKASDADEPITGHQIVSEPHFREMIAEQITDAFTLAAYAKYQAQYH